MTGPLRPGGEWRPTSRALTRDVIRDPLYGPITLDETARALIDTAAFQRLRRVRQLSEASALYPSAMHTRFEHSVGVYHLAKTMVAELRARGELGGVKEDEQRLVPYAALCHDLGHHVGAHLLEEFGYPGVSHEETGAAQFATGEVGAILAATGIPDAGRHVAELVQHQGYHPLGGVVSGACDADKMDYLLRDAYHCGLPAGFDQAHLRTSLTCVVNPESGRLELGLDADGLTSFEQMLYTKSILYRTVYFHRTVRCAMVMLREIIVAALDSGVISLDELRTWTDAELFSVIRERGGGRGTPPHVGRLVERLMARDLYSCVASLPLSAAAPPNPAGLATAERRLAPRLNLARGEVLVDVPRKPTMLSTDLSVRLASGRVVNASRLGPDDGFAMNEAQAALYAASGRVSVFTARPVRLDIRDLRHALEDAAVATVD